MADELFPWYPVALGRDVPSGVTRAVILNDAEVVLWRGADEQIHAWDDRCPHRGMRLSYGFVRGNALNCLYHGWAYEGSSHCTRIPAHPDLEVPKSIKASAYAVHEAGGLVWMSLSVATEGVPPVVTARAPLISIAVDRSFGAVRDFFGISQGATIAVRADILTGRSLMLALHPVTANKTMLHTLVIGEADIATLERAAVVVRQLRRDAELLAEAA
jgi:phenylpropionate dioxygenase-like ring-hydroxylating dioxygenase large terminal subunit